MAAYERRSFSEIAVDTTLAGTISDTDTTITLADATGWPTGSAGDFYVAVETEIIRIDTRSGTTLTVQTDGRGSVSTTAASHESGTPIILAFTADDADEANYAVSQTVGKVAAQGDLLTGSAANALQAITLGSTGLPLVAGASVPGYTQLGTSGIADDAVTSAKIAADAVGSSEIAADAVGSSELADSAVDTAAIAADAVTYAKIQNVSATDRLLGRDTASAGDVEELTVSGGVEFTGSGGIQRSALTGDVTASAGNNATTLADGVVDLANFVSTVRPITIGDSAPGSPTAGDFWFDTDDYALKEYTTATTGWTAPWNLPWGNLYEAQSAATTNISNGFTTETVVLTTSAVTIPAGRKIKVTAWATAVSGGTGPLNMTLRLRRGTTTGGTQIAYMEDALFDIGYPRCIPIIGFDTGASGSTQYVLTFAFSGASDSSAPYYISVDDVGPATNPS